MATYVHVRERRRITVSGAVAEEPYLADPAWRLVEPVKEPTPKERLQADARALDLDDSGTMPEIIARIDAKADELRKQAAELEIDADKLSAVELLAVVDAKLTE
jgi:hypothetical protein